MLLSMTVMGIVLGLVARTSSQQLRFYRDVDEIVARKEQVGSASAVAASMVRDVSVTGGDILLAQDSAFEVHASIGSAVVCSSAPGRITIPRPAVGTADTGSTLSAFTDTPDAGDRIAAFFEDSLGATWLTLHAAAAPISGGPCAAFMAIGATWDIVLQELITTPPRTALRFMRPLRLSLYRASDNRSYLGAKTWNTSTQQFNTIQPVAGPLRPYSAEPATTGLLFSYRDSSGDALELPIDIARVASITIVSRSRAGTDSSAIVVALRNRR
jgi:hypothetical protein